MYNPMLLLAAGLCASTGIIPESVEKPTGMVNGVYYGGKGRCRIGDNRGQKYKAKQKRLAAKKAAKAFKKKMRKRAR